MRDGKEESYERTQEGFLSFLILSFLNKKFKKLALRGEKTFSPRRKEGPGVPPFGFCAYARVAANFLMTEAFTSFST